jgi:predicted nucleotidyltransferase
MKRKDREILRQFAIRVREFAPEAKIWAFGSRVRGNATKESDLDICVVAKGLTEQDDDRIIAIAWEVGLEHCVVITPITYSAEEFSAGPVSFSPLVRVIHEEGVAA